MQDEDESYWLKRIINAMKSEQYAPPGKAGETPLSVLAEELNALDPNRGWYAVKAMASLVKTPPIEFMNGNQTTYWSDLCFLSDYIVVPDRQTLQSAFRLRLFGKESLAKDLKVYAMKGFVSSSGRLNKKELKDLVFLCEQRPIAWLDAAVRCGCFDLATDQAIALLKNESIDVGGFIFGLDMWHSKWEQKVNFEKIVKSFRDAVPDQTNKDKFDKWMHRRGYVDTNESTYNSFYFCNPARVIPPSNFTINYNSSLSVQHDPLAVHSVQFFRRRGDNPSVSTQSTEDNNSQDSGNSNIKPSAKVLSFVEFADKLPNNAFEVTKSHIPYQKAA